MLSIYEFADKCEKEALEQMKGQRRNAREQAVKIARQKVPARYKKQLKTATRVLRVVGQELGTKKWSDRRYVLDCVTIAKITDKMVIGTSGERVTFDSIIAWGC